MLIRILLVLFLLSPALQQALKGITFAFVAFLFSCQRTGLAERAARLPDPSVRVKRNVSVRHQPIPADPDSLNYLIFGGLKRSECRTAGTEDLMCRRRLCQCRRGNEDNRRGANAISTAFTAPAAPSTSARARKCLLAFELPFDFQRSLPRRDHA